MRAKWMGVAVAAVMACGVQQAEAAVVRAQLNGIDGANNELLLDELLDTKNGFALGFLHVYFGPFAGDDSGTERNYRISEPFPDISYISTHSRYQQTIGPFIVEFENDGPPEMEFFSGQVNAGGSGPAGQVFISFVPIPASAPLFGAALLVLGGIGYARRRGKPKIA